VAAGLVPASALAIDAGALNLFRTGRAEQNMIAAKPGIAHECMSEIFRERVEAFVVVARALGVNPALLR